MAAEEAALAASPRSRTFVTASQSRPGRYGPAVERTRQGRISLTSEWGDESPPARTTDWSRSGHPQMLETRGDTLRRTERNTLRANRTSESQVTRSNSVRWPRLQPGAPAPSLSFSPPGSSSEVPARPLVPPAPLRPPPPVPLATPAEIGPLLSLPNPPRTSKGLYRSMSISGNLNNPSSGASFARNSVVRRSRSRDDLRSYAWSDRTLYMYPPNGAYRTPMVLVPRAPPTQEGAQRHRTLRRIESTAHERKSRSLCTLLEERNFASTSPLPASLVEVEESRSPESSWEESAGTANGSLPAEEMTPKTRAPQVYYLLDDYLTPVSGDQTSKSSSEGTEGMIGRGASHSRPNVASFSSPSPDSPEQWHRRPSRPATPPLSAIRGATERISAPAPAPAPRRALRPHVSPERHLPETQLPGAGPRRREVERIRAAYRARLELERPRPAPVGASWHEANPLPIPRRQTQRKVHQEEPGRDCGCNRCQKAASEQQRSLKRRSYADPRHAGRREVRWWWW